MALKQAVFCDSTPFINSLHLHEWGGMKGVTRILGGEREIDSLLTFSLSVFFLGMDEEICLLRISGRRIRKGDLQGRGSLRSRVRMRGGTPRGPPYRSSSLVRCFGGDHASR